MGEDHRTSCLGKPPAWFCVDRKWSVKKRNVTGGKSLKVRKDILIFCSSRDIPRWLNVADILLHTASIEGFPNTIIEAQAAGAPVVALQAGALKKLLFQIKVVSSLRNRPDQTF